MNIDGSIFYRGIRIYEDPNLNYIKPVLELRNFDWMDAEFKLLYNEWLLLMFGEKEIIYFFDNQESAIVSPSYFKRLKQKQELERL